METKEAINNAIRTVARYMELETHLMPCGNYAVEFPINGFQKRLVTNHYVSLDALVPVWEKIGIAIKLNGSHVHINDPRFFINEEGGNIFEAALFATANAIEELKQ